MAGYFSVPGGLLVRPDLRSPLQGAPPPPRLLPIRPACISPTRSFCFHGQVALAAEQPAASGSRYPPTPLAARCLPKPRQPGHSEPRSRHPPPPRVGAPAASWCVSVWVSRAAHAELYDQTTLFFFKGSPGMVLTTPSWCEACVLDMVLQYSNLHLLAWLVGSPFYMYSACCTW